MERAVRRFADRGTFFEIVLTAADTAMLQFTKV
jgi:hypothetical protein